MHPVTQALGGAPRRPEVIKKCGQSHCTPCSYTSQASYGQGHCTNRCPNNHIKLVTSSCCAHVEAHVRIGPKLVRIGRSNRSKTWVAASKDIGSTVHATGPKHRATLYPQLLSTNPDQHPHVEHESPTTVFSTTFVSGCAQQRIKEEMRLLKQNLNPNEVD